MKTNRFTCDKCSNEFKLENSVGVYIVREYELFEKRYWKKLEEWISIWECISNGIWRFFFYSRNYLGKIPMGAENI